MAQTVLVWARTRFVGFHRWKNAPESVSFLRMYHRHEFHVEVGKTVLLLDREIEFTELKRKVDDLLTTYSGYDNRFDHSCEQLAEIILVKMDMDYVTVSEDGENGATVTRKDHKRD